jgi:hypothetical protein
MEAGAIYTFVRLWENSFTIQILKLLNGLDMFSKVQEHIAYIMNTKNTQITKEKLFGGVYYLELIKTLKSLMARVVSIPKKELRLKDILKFKDVHKE